MNAPQPTAAADPRHDRRQRRLLVGLAALFFAPIALSFYLYYGHSGLAPVGRVNRGTLIVPPHGVPVGGMIRVDGGLPTDPDFLRGKWTLLYVELGPCADACRRKLYDTRQVRTALDRDMTRVQRVFVTGTECCDLHWLQREHPDLIAVRTDAPQGTGAAPGTDTAQGTGAALLAALPTFAATPAGHADRIYVIDPLGNLMMTYPPDFQPKGLLEDMKRLLKLSHIG